MLPRMLALVCASLHVSVAMHLSSPASGMMRFRGGSDDMPGDSTEDPPKALTKQEITDKLNAIPTFCMLNKDNNIVGTSDAEGKPTCCWYTDPEEAQAVLAAMKEANPDAADGLHMGCIPLGEAFKVCKGWPAEVGEEENEETKSINLKIQGTRRIGSEVIPALLKQLEEQEIDPGCWQLPVCA